MVETNKISVRIDHSETILEEFPWLVDAQQNGELLTVDGLTSFPSLVAAVVSS